MIRGLDLNHYNGAVNLSTLKSRHGLSFVGAKCTEGTGYTDTEYAHNRSQAAALGLPLIAYHFARPEASSALTQARRLVDTAGHVQGLCLDLEASQLSQSATNAWMREFGDDLRALAPDVTTFVYLGGYAANGSGQGSVGHFDHWWYPRYPGLTSWPTSYSPNVGGNTTGWHVPPAPSIWQFTDNLGGIDGNVSNLTIDQLFSGANMPLSPADIAAIWAYGIPSKRPAGGDVPAAAYLSSIDLNVVNLPSAAEIAAAVQKVLPTGQGGTAPSAQEIATAVVAEFATKLGVTS